MNRPADSVTRTVAFIGAGRVARGLGARLREAGWKIGAVVARQLPSARAAVRSIGGGTACAGLTRRVLDSSVILLAVPDDALAAVAAELERIGGDELRRKVVAHTSGALGSAVLLPLARRGAWTGALHPMQTFGARARTHLEGVLFGIEGHPQALGVLRKIVRSLGGDASRIEPGRKAEYHCAGTFAAAHVLASVEAGVQLLLAAGMKRREATRALLRLARQVLDNQELLGPQAAWTGPLSRGDISTIELHRQALGAHPVEVRGAYDAMTRLAARLLSRAPDALLARLVEVAPAAGEPDPPGGSRPSARAAAAQSAS
ncbi:MAG TPA: Rossmann-like and DUF2520 domain-containing protein [Candidatus Acidoferrales bacterium]|nr:Rossmann-like and DUF2520 domain-containing protein [Candidatus Acidoferrales bacterium]